MKTPSLLLASLLFATAGLAACDKRAPLDKPTVTPTTPSMSTLPSSPSSTPNAVMPPPNSAASAASAP